MSAGLIVSIGGQNALVLKQGLTKNHVFMTAAFCALSDSILISLGVGGFGQMITSNSILLTGATWGGAAFLFWYGLKSFRSVFQSKELDVSSPDRLDIPNRRETLYTLAFFTFLNPHVYLDTIVLLGSIGSQFCLNSRIYFAIGAISASFIWFFGISYGARFLSPLFKNATAWKILDFLIGCIMWNVAFSLLLNRNFVCA